MNLMSDDERLAYRSVINDIATTFQRPITIYKTAERVVVSTNPNYNYGYDQNQQYSEVSTTAPVSGVFNARIFALSTEQANQLLFMSASTNSQTSSETRLAQVKNIVRIKLDKEGYEFMKEAKNVDLDGDRYAVISSARKHGLFSPDFYTYYLQRTD